MAETLTINMQQLDGDKLVAVNPKTNEDVKSEDLTGNIKRLEKIKKAVSIAGVTSVAVAGTVLLKTMGATPDSLGILLGAGSMIGFVADTVKSSIAKKIYDFKAKLNPEKYIEDVLKKYEKAAKKPKSFVNDVPDMHATTDEWREFDKKVEEKGKMLKDVVASVKYVKEAVSMAKPNKDETLKRLVGLVTEADKALDNRTGGKMAGVFMGGAVICNLSTALINMPDSPVKATLIGGLGTLGACIAADVIINRKDKSRTVEEIGKDMQALINNREGGR